MSSTTEPSANPGLVLCFGCGLAPEAGQVHVRADGSDCPTCAARLVESQPTLLPRLAAQLAGAPGAQWAGAPGAQSAGAPGAQSPGKAGDPVLEHGGAELLAEAEPHAALPTTVGRRAGTERFRVLTGGACADHPEGPVPILDPGPDEPA